MPSKRTSILIPRLNRVNSTDIPTLIVQLNFLLTDGIVGNGTLSVKTSVNEDFTGAVSSNPSEFRVSADGSAWSLRAGNVLAFADISKQIKIEMPAIGVETHKFFMVVYTEGAKIFESSPMVFTSWTQIQFNLNAPINRGTVRPKKAFVSGVIYTKVATTYTSKVEVTNNAFDASPTWEDMTSAYLAKGFYDFTNFTKVNGNWGISVRITLTKANVTDEIEISGFNVSWI